MEIKNFAELISKVKGSGSVKRMVIAAAGEEHTIDAALHAMNEGIVRPIFVGDAAKIKEILSEKNANIPDGDIYDAPEPEAAAAKAVELVRNGEGDFLMKGYLDTKVILKAVVNKETGLGTGRLMSHFTMFEVPGYHKILVAVDGGMVTYPDLQMKKEIILNTIDVLHAYGYENPKVGVLACVEKVNPKMPETVDADELKKMNESGEIPGCIVEGPISYDCAMSKEIADFKGYESKIAGNVDVLIVPNIHAGNILGKVYTVTCKGNMAGFIVGAKCPIVLTSRGSSAEEKYMSIVVSAAAVK